MSLAQLSVTLKHLFKLARIYCMVNHMCEKSNSEDELIQICQVSGIKNISSTVSTLINVCALHYIW